MTEVQASTIKAFGLDSRQIVKKEPSGPLEHSTCANCGHRVVMSDGRAIHAPADLNLTYKCWITVTGVLGKSTFCGCVRPVWSDKKGV